MIIFLVILLGCYQAQGSAPDFTLELMDMPIPYSFDNGYSDEQKTAVRDTLKLFQDNSCLSFVEDSAPEGKILYTWSTSGTCWANIVLPKSWEHRVYLLPDCMSTTGIQHETMHALGFRHTQVRHDRDNYVIVSENVLTKSNYRKLEVLAETTTYGIPYEFNSILHYSIDEDMQLKDNEWRSTVFGNNMVFNDWKVLNMRYKCDETCGAKLPCKNGGYQHPRKCSECICPRFHEGTTCETERNVVLLTPGKSETLNYGWKASAERSKMITDDRQFDKSPAHIIKAPAGSFIRIHIDHLTDPSPWSNENSTCNQYGMEIAQEDLTRVGKRYCSHVRIGKTIISESNVIGFLVYSSPGYGFAANVTFSVEGSSSVPMIEQAIANNEQYETVDSAPSIAVQPARIERAVPPLIDGSLNNEAVVAEEAVETIPDGPSADN